MKKYLKYLPVVGIVIFVFIVAFVMLNGPNKNETVNLVDDTDLIEEELPTSIPEESEEPDVAIENLFEDTSTETGDLTNGSVDESLISESIIENICDGNECDEILIISKESQEQLETRINTLQTKTDTIFLDLEEYDTQLISKENIISQEDYQNLVSSYQDYYTQVNSNVSVYLDSLTNLNSQISSLSIVGELEFSEQVNTIANSLQDLNSDVRNQLVLFYTSFNSQTKINDPDLIISDIKINRIVKDNDIIFINLIVQNIGNDDADVMFTYHFDFEVNDNYVDKCSGEAEQLDIGAQVLIECEFNIEDYYTELVDGDVNILALELTGEIDSHTEIREINEENNDFVWYTELILSDFNE